VTTVSPSPAAGLDNGSARPHSVDAPITVVIATLMRPTGETGVQTHFNGVLRLLERGGGTGTLVTPFSAPRGLVYPVFAARRLVDPLSGPASVWWYRHWHAQSLRYALRRELVAHADGVVVYAQCPVSAAVALDARRDELQRVVMVVHFNTSQADEWAGKGRIRVGDRLYRRIKAFEERVLPRLDGIVYVSDFMREQLEERIPSLRETRAAVIPNFVEVTSAREPRRLRGDLVNVGTLEPRKNQRYLLEILSVAKRLGHEYTLALIGDGPDRSSLEARARELGITGQVRFLGFRPDAASLIVDYRAYCHAARAENFGLTFLEAMAHGVPILSTRTGGTGEVFRDGVEGVTWPLDSPPAAARTLVSLLEDPAELERLGAAGRRRVIECFSSAVVGPRLLDFLSGE
jgi:glycosyltransferase involved in cell wall biosynthesis